MNPVWTGPNPYIIAEIGVNHEGSLERADDMIRQVARAGGHAAKFQTYKAAKLASRGNSPAYWDTTKEPTLSQFDLFQKHDSFGSKEYEHLAQTCADAGIDFMSTPFDSDAVEMLAPLVPGFKIASADITNAPLLDAVAATGKPVIMSTGASTLDEIDWAVERLRGKGVSDLTLLGCVLRYPTPPEDANLAIMETLQQRYEKTCRIGYSDHVAPQANGEMPAMELAALRGATVLEKHFTFDQSLPGNDHYHAMDEAGLRAFTDKLDLYRVLWGSPLPDLEAQKQAISNARRKIVATRDLEKGQVLVAANLIPLRANTGISAAEWDAVVGRTLACDVAADTPISLDHLV